MLTVATGIFGPGFPLYEPVEDWPGCEFVCFTDQPLESSRWKIIRQSHQLPPRRSNRHVKTLLHRYVSGTTLYIDSEFRVIGNPVDLVADTIDERSMSATRHPQRDCLYDEADFCIKKGCTEDPDALAVQVARYRAAGMPEHFGLWAGSIIARRGDSESNRLCEEWWSEICRGAERDQVSLPFVSWRLGTQPATIPGTYHKNPQLQRRKSVRKYV